MTRLTHEYLEEQGFHQHESMSHNYRSGFTRYYDEVDRSITFLSTLSIYNGVRENYENEEFDVYFWGRNTDRGNQYAEIDSHLRISTVEEFETLINMLRD